MNAQYQAYLSRSGRHIAVVAKDSHPKPARRDTSIKAWDAAIEEAKERAERLKKEWRHAQMTTARWDVRLWAVCPHCGTGVNLTDEPEFWLDHDEEDIRAGLELSVSCPECLRNFEVITA